MKSKWYSLIYLKTFQNGKCIQHLFNIYRKWPTLISWSLLFSNVTICSSKCLLPIEASSRARSTSDWAYQRQEAYLGINKYTIITAGLVKTVSLYTMVKIEQHFQINCWLFSFCRVISNLNFVCFNGILTWILSNIYMPFK